MTRLMPQPVTPHDGGPIPLADQRLAGWSAFTTVALLALWTLSAGESGRYVLYALPFILILLHALLFDFRLRIDLRGAAALAIYLAAAALSLLHADALGPYASRDVLIVGGYLLLFTFSFRAPPAIVDIISVGLVVGLAIEASRKGLSLRTDFLESDGILESGYAFPLGAVLLYNLYARRWLPSLIVGLFFFAAYKRIAILAVVMIALIWLIVRLLRLERHEKAVAVSVVVFCSAISLFSMHLFEWWAAQTGAEGSSANALSLGRFELVRILWNGLYQANLGDVMFGFGPGAADAAIETSMSAASNPHNDWVKILYDYGVVGVLAIHAILFLLFSRNSFSRMLYVYAGILMTTDNTFIYMYHQSIVYLVYHISTGTPLPPVRMLWNRATLRAKSNRGAATNLRAQRQVVPSYPGMSSTGAIRSPSPQPPSPWQLPR